jgi:hypothetical protein
VSQPVTHDQAGATWDGDMVTVHCSCGWASTPVQTGRHWIENLNQQYADHLADVAAGT